VPLTLLTGPANAAKAGVVFDAFRDAAPCDPLLVVPTRADALRYERELAEQGAVFGGRVLATGQLAGQIAAASGYGARIAGPLLRERLIVAAAHDIRPRALAASVATGGFAAGAARFLAELEGERVTPDQLSSAAHSAVARELAALYAAYRARLERAGVEDRERFFWRALDALRAAPERWRARPVFFYGFDDLTRLERDAIETLSHAAAAEVWVSLAFEPGRAALDGRAFSFNELRGLADEHVELPALATHYEPASREALHHLERALFEPDEPSRPASQVAAGDAVELLEAGGERAEVELVGAWALERLREGIAPEEIAIVQRSPERRASLLRGVLAAYGVPASIAVERPFCDTALGRGLIGLLRAALEPGSAGGDDVLAWLRAPGVLERTGLADSLEAQLRRGRGRSVAAARTAWERAHPGFPLDQLDAVAAAGGPRALLNEVAHQLERLLAAPRRRAAARLEGDERLDARAYIAARGALDELEAMQGGAAPPSPRELIELLAALGVRDGDEPAPGLVTVCDPLRVRAQRYRAVAITGLQEGELPRAVPPDGFLGDQERSALAAAGVPLRPREDPLGDERALFYALASRPTARLALAYRVSDEDGNASEPSFFLEDVRKLYDPPPAVRRRPLADVVWDVASAPTERERARALTAAAPSVAPTPLAPPVGADVREPLEQIAMISAGSLECFADCGVKWLVERWLRSERLEPEPEPMLRGRLVHAALERALSALRAARGSGALSGESLPTAVELYHEALSAAAADEGLDGDDGASAAMLARLRAQGERVLAFEAEHASGWEPAHLELSFGMGEEELPGLELAPDLGVHGRVDRVDVAPDGRRAAVRDYKSSGGPAQAKWGSERSLQVALYMLAAGQLLDLDVVAGLYQPLQGADLRPRGLVVEGDGPDGAFFRDDRVSREVLKERLEQARVSALALAGELRAGAVLPRPESCGGQRGCRYPGVCRASAP
jgi:hypothetical protein